ncbi:MAG: tRNA uridine-5-carboxymethylaminomethyl(34) synthesis GTPase MnmE [Candidatus Midichloriaceae bacterium]
MPQRDTIFALSTCYGKSGIAIIKISGPNALKILQDLNFKKNPLERVATLGKIYKKNLEIIDEVIVIYFPKNHSYTGEDIVELQTHGGIAIINSIFYELNSFDYLRLATNGEFTRIALENNKISLNKAESLIDLINSESEYQRKVAIRNYNGELEQSYLSWRNSMVELLSLSEAYIDFPDDLLDETELERLNQKIIRLKDEFEKNIKFFSSANKLMNGINICIAGSTNVGKSTLMNFLSKADTSIISNIKGTTRDVIKTKIEISGIPVILQDTAGIRTTSDEIENIGIEKGKDAIKNSDIIIFMLDANDLLNLDIIIQTKKWLNTASKVLIYVNKIDLLNNYVPLKENLTKQLKSVNFKYEDLLFLSLKSTEFDQIIFQNIERILNYFMPSTDANLVTNIRHQNKLENCNNYLGSALNTDILELKSEELRACAKELGLLLGDINTEEVLDKIFSSFCIGK